MSQFFNFTRFTLLVLKHWADNKNRYALSVLAFIGLLATWFLFTIFAGMDNIPMGQEIQHITFFLALFAVGTFYASQFFSDLGSRAKGINFLLVPASAFEKLLCGLLYSVLLFFVVFTAAFYLVDFFMILLAGSVAEADTVGNKPAVINILDVIVLHFNSDTTINFLAFFFSVQGAFLLGSVYFEKYTFIKTVIACFAVWCILFFTVFFFNQQLLPDGTYHKGFFTSYRVMTDDADDRLIQMPDWIGRVFQFLIIYALAPFLWIVTYYRLKEKQV